MTTNRLSVFLHEAQKYHVRFDGGLTNHLPMVLIALHKLGAYDQKLAEYSAYYQPRLEVYNKVDSLVIGDVQEHLGKEIYFYAYVDFFQKQLKNRDMGECLSEYLHILLPGIGASAFHGLIRLAYGIEIHDKVEISFALADWAAYFLSFDLNKSSVAEDMFDILHRVTPMARGFKFRPGTIVDRMAEISQVTSLRECRLQPERLSLEDIAQVALHAYAASGNFTMLHGVTGCHALRVILPFCSHPHYALRSYWEALVVAYLSTGAVDIRTIKPFATKLYDWDVLKPRVYKSQNDHQIKLLYTLWQESLISSNSLYVHVANRLVSEP